MVARMAEEAKRPLIGVMPKFVVSERIPRTVSACDSLVMATNYLEAVVAAGGVPLVIPITDNDDVYETLLPQLDGFLLTGGVDLDPRLYGGDEANETLSTPVPERERVEMRVLDYVFQNDMPLLGICRGIQLLNVYCGGTLHEDLPKWLPAVDDEGNPIAHWQGSDYDKPSHTVRLAEGSMLQELLGANEVRTNSMHHQGIRDLAPRLEAMAYGPGGVVEAVRATDLSFVVGLQWHPEYLGTQGNLNRIFEKLVSEAVDYRARK